MFTNTSTKLTIDLQYEFGGEESFLCSQMPFDLICEDISQPKRLGVTWPDYEHRRGGIVLTPSMDPQSIVSEKNALRRSRNCVFMTHLQSAAPLDAPCPP